MTNKPMSARQFKGCARPSSASTVASQRTSRLLGLGIRHIMRVAKAGEQPVTRPLSSCS